MRGRKRTEHSEEGAQGTATGGAWIPTITAPRAGDSRDHLCINYKLQMCNLTH